MRCGRCDGENPEGAKFCIECGGVLSRRCAQCGFENLPRAKFCAECGASLPAQPTSPVPSSKPVLSLVEGSNRKSQKLLIPDP